MQYHRVTGRSRAIKPSKPDLVVEVANAQSLSNTLIDNVEYTADREIETFVRDHLVYRRCSLCNVWKPINDLYLSADWRAIPYSPQDSRYQALCDECFR